MASAILLHGKQDHDEYYDPDTPSNSNDNWFPWLQKQLIVHDISTQTPEIPDSWQPDYPIWQKEFERYDITPDTLLVGHSCGAGFIVRWLSEHPDQHVGKVVLVAPSLGIDWDAKDFFDYDMDPNLVSRTKGLTIFGSDDDRPAIKQAINTYQNAIKGISYREFHAYGHFTRQSMGSDQFPELLTELLP